MSGANTPRTHLEPPAAPTITEMWNALGVTVSGANWVMVPPTPRPVIPQGTPGVLIPYINRAYQVGSISFATNDLTLQLEAPPDVEGNNAGAMTGLWEFFWQGYRYGQHDSNTNRPAPADRTRAPKVSDPELFEGDREKFADFVTQLHLVFRSDPPRYQADASKLTYAASYLRGSAKRWFTPHVNGATGVI